MRAGPTGSPGRWGETVLAVAVLTALLWVYAQVFMAFLPTEHGTLGHDFGLALAAYTDGFIWFGKNGPLAVPWFTPSFCGGQPFFADPQSGYYSLPQWLSFAMDPLSATIVTLLVFAALGSVGLYLLARIFFDLPIGWSLLAGALYLFNGFLAHRMILGETGYHAINLAPWLALALLMPVRGVVGSVGWAILAGCIAGYWLQSGLATLMVPAALSVALVLLVYRLGRPWPRDILVRTTLAVGLSVALSASKLVASLAFYSRFERTQYQLPGFGDLWALVQTNLLALFGPSEAAFRISQQHLLNAQYTVLPHEWAYGFTAAPLVVVLAALAIGRFTAQGERAASVPAGDGQGAGSRPLRWLVALAITVIASLPLLLQVYTPGLNAFYKGLPLIGATAWPMRWLILYLPALPIAVGLLGQRALGPRQDLGPWVVTAGVLVLVGLNLAEGRSYYLNQPYRPDRLLSGYDRLMEGGVKGHRIVLVGLKTDPETGAVVGDEGRNDLVVEGVSQAQCYNPSFGYRLEKLPVGRLMLGGALEEEDGFLNIKNPACYVFPEENGCAPGDHFRVDQRAAAEAFVSYRPFPFEKSAGQRVADLVTMVSLVAVGGFLLVVWPWSAWRGSRHRGSAT